MPTSATWNIWSPDDTAPIAPIEGLFQQQATSVDLALTSVRRRASTSVGSSTERDALFPQPTQGNRVFRTDLGYEEGYFAVYNATSNPGGRQSVGWQRVATYSLDARNLPTTNGSTSLIPANVILQDRIFFTRLTTNAQGVGSITFPDGGFPTAVAWIQGTTFSGSGVNPVVNAQALTRSAVNFIWPGSNNATIDVMVRVVGY